MVYGLPIHDVDPMKRITGHNTSVKRLVTSLMGKNPAFAPKIATPGLLAWVDARNVVEAHVKTMGLPQAISERFLLSYRVACFEDGLQGLRARGEKGLGEEGERCDPSKHFAIDTSKAQRMLGLELVSFQKR